MKYQFDRDIGEIHVNREILETMIYVNHPCHVKTEIVYSGKPMMISVSDGVPKNASVSKGEIQKQMWMDWEEPILLSYQLTFLGRGRHQFLPLTITFHDQLYLFQTQIDVSHQTMVMVHSDPVEIQKASYSSSVEEDALVIPSLFGAEKSMEFEGIRAFSPGDSLHEIDWKASSRFQSLVSKIFNRQESIDTVIFLDVSRSMRRRMGRKTKLDHGIDLALQLAHIFQDIHHPVGFMAYDEHQTIVTIPPTFNYHQIFQACSHLPNSIEVDSYHPTFQDTSNKKKGDSSTDDDHFLSTISPFLSGGGKPVKSRLQTSGVYQTVSSYYPQKSPARLLYISDLENDAESLVSTMNLARLAHHKQWLITLFSPFYDDTLKKQLSVEQVEHLYQIQHDRELLLTKLRKNQIEVVDLTSTMYGIHAVKSLQGR